MDTKPRSTQLHDIVIWAVAFHFDVPLDTLQYGKSQKTQDVYKRWVSFYLLRKNITFASREYVADLFRTGKSTVEYGEEKISDFLKAQDIRLIHDLEDIQELINSYNSKKKRSKLKSLLCTPLNTLPA